MNQIDGTLYVNQSEICALFGCSVTTLKRIHMQDMNFPNPVFPTGRRGLWRLDEIRDYIAQRVQRLPNSLQVTGGAGPGPIVRAGDE